MLSFISPVMEGYSMGDDSLDTFVEVLHRFTLERDRLGGTALEQFLCYRKELLDWNTRVNLTAITTPEEVLTKHFLDSL
jgi:16S rRNA (guanine527-N7)-methyltransferase